MIIKIGGIYKHFKGNTYRVLNIASHSETEEELVIYQDLNDNSKIFARPVNMFLEKIEKNKKRFELIE